MQDVKFFEAMLGLTPPWRVKTVELDLQAQSVTVEVEVTPGTAWGEEGAQCAIHSWEQREWRHLDTMQFATVIRARVPRVRRRKPDKDGEPGGWTTEMVGVPWAQPQSRWTLSFEAWAVRVLQASVSLKAAAALLRLHEQSAHAIMERAVARGLAQRRLEEVTAVGIDDKSYGQGHDAASIFNDIAGGRVLEVVRGTTVEAACRAIDCLPPEQAAKVEAAALDMSAAYKKALEIKLPQALPVYDRYHISAMLGSAVDQVRRAEHKALSAAGDARLKGTRHDWLFDPAELSEARLERLDGLLAADLRTGRAYAYRINFTGFWECRSRGEGAAYFAKWYRSAVRSALGPVKKAARTLKAHLEGLLNYFTHRISNAVSEGLNSSIQKLKANARGFRNFENYRTRILFFLGKLSLMPRTHSST